MTGTGATASTTAGTSGSVATPLQTCPPASHPCATIDVHSTPDRAPRFLDAADRVHDKPSGVMHLVDVAAGIAPEERHDPQTRRKCLIDSMVLIRGENEVAGKGPVGEGCRFPNHVSGIIGPPQPQGAEAAGIRDRGGQAGICSDSGASTIGCSIPSNSHTGVWVLIGIAPFLAPAAPVD